MTLTVYKYKDEYYGKFFILKRAKKGLNDKEIERFRREYLTMSNLSSPYVAEVYNFNDKNNEYTMEYADKTLDDFIIKNNNTIKADKRIRIVHQILRAFLYIHSKDLLHRDISPTNILIKQYDDIDTIKISDFGLVKIPESSLTSVYSERKGCFNDPNLDIVGFDKYEMRHETYALTRIIHFVMTGKIKLERFPYLAYENFVKKGINADINQRYKNVDELRLAFKNITQYFL